MYGQKRKSLREQEKAQLKFLTTPYTHTSHTPLDFDWESSCCFSAEEQKRKCIIWHNAQRITSHKIYYLFSDYSPPLKSFHCQSATKHNTRISNITSSFYYCCCFSCENDDKDIMIILIIHHQEYFSCFPTQVSFLLLFFNSSGTFIMQKKENHLWRACLFSKLIVTYYSSAVARY